MKRLGVKIINQKVAMPIRCGVEAVRFRLPAFLTAFYLDERQGEFIYEYRCRIVLLTAQDRSRFGLLGIAESLEELAQVCIAQEDLEQAKGLLCVVEKAGMILFLSPKSVTIFQSAIVSAGLCFKNYSNSYNLPNIDSFT